MKTIINIADLPIPDRNSASIALQIAAYRNAGKDVEIIGPERWVREAFQIADRAEYIQSIALATAMGK
jgi:hypothetical protein